MPASQERWGSMEGMPEMGEVWYYVSKTLELIMRECGRAEGATRPPEWKTIRGETQVME